MNETTKTAGAPTIGAVDLSGMMAGSIVRVLQESQGGMMDVGLTLAALSKAAGMVMGSMPDKGARLALVNKFRLQAGLDTAEVADQLAALAEEDRPVTVDVNKLGGLN